MRPITQATIVRPLLNIQVTRTLPSNAQLLVRVGQTVTSFQAVARALQKVTYHVVDAHKWLQGNPEDVAEQLQLSVGDIVDSETVLLSKGGAIGKRTLTAPVAGILHKVHNGRIIIQQNEGWADLRAMVAGRVAKQLGDQGVVLEVNGAQIQAAWGRGPEGYGKLALIARTPSTPLMGEHLTDDLQDHVVVAGQLWQPEMLETAVHVGVAGIIVGSISAKVYEKANNLSFPLFVTDGVGRQGLSSTIFDLLSELEGQEASLIYQEEHNPFSPTRPEIIVAQPAQHNTEAIPQYDSIDINQTVRIIGSLSPNEIGKITKLYKFWRPTHTLVNTRGVDVELANGNVRFVPYANIDTIL